MPIKPILRDDNGLPLADKGSEVITKRFTSVATEGQAISLGADVKWVVIHIEGTTVQAKITGTLDGSQEINWTSDGYSLPALEVVKEADDSIITIAAPSGTIDVSVIGWR